MKTIGLIGGMSWESTVTYYQVINEVVKQKLGGFNSAKCLLYSVNFDEIEKCQMSGNWQKSGEILHEAALALKKGGADFVVLSQTQCTKLQTLSCRASICPFCTSPRQRQHTLKNTT